MNSDHLDAIKKLIDAMALTRTEIDGTREVIVADLATPRAERRQTATAIEVLRWRHRLCQVRPVMGAQKRFGRQHAVRLLGSRLPCSRPSLRPRRRSSAVLACCLGASRTLAEAMAPLVRAGTDP
ncbi:hypothetical protein [Pseudorhodoferax soli]|uniref:hypothetical protein n=1 Tax=Pseudorhodoferax soli TaxID=545864 RepID=UPI0011C03FA2|nr:hypothetical protein [Pseudorhodoferax soli]